MLFYLYDGCKLNILRSPNTPTTPQLYFHSPAALILFKLLARPSPNININTTSLRFDRHP